MNRRQFLYRTALGVPTLIWLPTLLGGCKKAIPDNLKFDGKVIVIGAGAAGLYAAQILIQQGANVIILEANDRIGGRIKDNTEFSDYPLELGAEEIQGEKSILHASALAAGAQFIDADLQDYFYFNGSLKTSAQATENTLFTNMTDAVDQIIDYTGGDTSAATYADISNISDNVAHIFNALVGNQNGSDNTRIGMHGLRSKAEKWTAGQSNFLMRNKSLYDVLSFACPDAMNHVVLQSAVTQVDTSGSQVMVQTADGTAYFADAVVCTVPITQLKNNSIQFIPALANAKISAIQKIGMDRGIKIILKFSERIWPSDLSCVYGKRRIPKFFVSSGGGRTDEFIIAGIVNGSNAEFLAGLGEQGLIDEVLSELEELFGEATTSFLSAIVQDWGNEPYIEGAFSYPLPDMGNAIEIIAQPAGDRLFFAGEATHTAGHAGTVHGALETGLRAALEIIQLARKE